MTPPGYALVCSSILARVHSCPLECTAAYGSCRDRPLPQLLTLVCDWGLLRINGSTLKPLHRGDRVVSAVSNLVRQDLWTPRHVASYASTRERCVAAARDRVDSPETCPGRRRSRRLRNLPRQSLEGLLDELLDGTAIPGATRAQLAVMLEAIAMRKLPTCRVEDRDVAMRGQVVPGRLVWDVLQLDADAACVQLIDQRLHATGVVVPSPSVHEGPILKGQ